MKKVLVYFLLLSNCFFASNQTLKDSLREKKQAPLILFSVSYGFFNTQKKLVADYFGKDNVTCIGPITGKIDFRILRRTSIGFSYGHTNYSVSSYATNSSNSGISVNTIGARICQFIGINENAELYLALGGGGALVNNTVSQSYLGNYYYYHPAPDLANGYIEAVVGVYLKPSEVFRIHFEGGISRYCFLTTGLSFLLYK